MPTNFHQFIIVAPLRKSPSFLVSEDGKKADVLPTARSWNRIAYGNPVVACATEFLRDSRMR